MAPATVPLCHCEAVRPWQSVLFPTPLGAGNASHCSDCQKARHCEEAVGRRGNPVTFLPRFRGFLLLSTGFPRQCTHWLGMTWSFLTRSAMLRITKDADCHVGLCPPRNDRGNGRLVLLSEYGGYRSRGTARWPFPTKNALPGFGEGCLIIVRFSGPPWRRGAFC